MSENNIKNEDVGFDWAYLEWITQLENEWKESLPRYTDRELLEIFPEVTQIIPGRLKELTKELRGITNTIKRKLRVMYEKVLPENQWFYRQVIRQFDGVELLRVKKQILYFGRLAAIERNDNSKDGAITENVIQKALSTPIIDIASRNTKLRRSGKAFVGLCPFHKEKSPSFYVYPKSNSFYCFGCQKGGNVINFVREINGLSFREAINYLT